MAHVTLTYPLTDGTAAKGSEVRANDNDIVAQINGNLDDSNIKVGAAIDGKKLSNLATFRVPEDRIEDDAITAAKLRDDAGVDANRAVTTNHIRDLAVTEAKLAALSVSAGKVAANAVLAAKVKLATFAWLIDAGEGTVADGNSIYTSTGIGVGNAPLNFYTQSAATPDANERELNIGLHYNTATLLWYVRVHNNSGASINFGLNPVTVIVNFISAT